jgi:hypothetical protein
MHSFSNISDFAARLFTRFPNFTLDRRYGTLLLSLLPVSHRPQHTAQVTSRAKCCLPPLLVLEVEEAVEMSYGDDALDSGVRDEFGEGWNAEYYDTGRRVRMV